MRNHTTEVTKENHKKRKRMKQYCDAAGKMNLSLFYVFKSKIVDAINRANV